MFDFIILCYVFIIIIIINYSRRKIKKLIMKVKNRPKSLENYFRRVA